MAGITDIETKKNYCDRLFNELTEMKDRLSDLMKAAEQFPDEHVSSHAPHINDIIKTIDWKRDILVKACSIEWKETVAPSVQSTEEPFSGGYVGG